MASKARSIPKRLWVYWHQGTAGAPFVVTRCIESWIYENPGWDVVVLDRESLDRYIVPDLPAEKLARMGLNKQTNLFRLQLLAEYGGVWADATTLCMRPLDEWIYECMTSGFFAFHRPGPDRLIANWFIAAEKASPVVVKLKDRYASFFAENRFDVEAWPRQILIRLLSKLLSRNEKTAGYWLSPVVTKRLKIYPYLVFHYLFGQLVSEDPECRQIWRATRKVSADGPHKIRHYGYFSPLTDTIRQEIDEKREPFYKLTWKYDSGRYSPGSVLYYLLDERNREKA